MINFNITVELDKNSGMIVHQDRDLGYPVIMHFDVSTEEIYGETYYIASNEEFNLVAQSTSLNGLKKTLTKTIIANILLSNNVYSL